MSAESVRTGSLSGLNKLGDGMATVTRGLLGRPCPVFVGYGWLLLVVMAAYGFWLILKVELWLLIISVMMAIAAVYLLVYGISSFAVYRQEKSRQSWEYSVSARQPVPTSRGPRDWQPPGDSAS